MTEPRNWQTLLDHAVRRWNAEEENARRLSRRVNITLLVVAAFLGLGALQYLDHRIEPPELNILSVVLILIGLAMLALAAGTLLLRRIETERPPQNLVGNERKPQASVSLFPDGADLALVGIDTEVGGVGLPTDLKVETEEEGVGLPTDLWVDTEEADRWLAWLLTTQGANDLLKQNLKESSRIDRAQQLLVAGFIILFFGLGFHIAGKHYETSDDPSTFIAIQKAASQPQASVADTMAGDRESGQQETSAE